MMRESMRYKKQKMREKQNSADQRDPRLQFSVGASCVFPETIYFSGCSGWSLLEETHE